MGKVLISLPDDLEERFRKEVSKRLGMKKGNLAQAVREALEMWISGEAIKLSKLVDKHFKEHLRRIDEDEKLTPKQRKLAKNYFAKRVDELLPEYMSLIVEHIVKELKFRESARKERD
jgi:hypothetical protein